MRIITLVLIFLSFSQFAYAKFELRASVKGSGQVVWDNVQNLSTNEMLPTQWQTPTALPTVNKWVPATFVTNPTTNVNFSSGSGNTSADVSIQVLGLQFNMIGVNHSVDTSGLSSGCTRDDVTGDVVTVSGSSCTSKHLINNAVSQVPFTLYRPIVNIDETKLVEAFKVNNLTKGIYTAFVPINVRVPYYAGEVLTQRIFTDSIFVIIDYQPSTITNVTLSTNNVTLTPKYDALNKTISANDSLVDITATGYFDKGLVLDIVDRPIYQMVHETEPSLGIPYHIACLGCGGSATSSILMVDQDGKVNDSSITILNDGTARTSVHVQLGLGYFNVDGTNLLSGDYSDTIDLTFRPGI